MQPFDPSLPSAETIRAVPADVPELGAPEMKALIAGQVRSDSAERKAPTQEHAVQGLLPDLPRERLGELLAEMAAEATFGDIKAIVAPSGRVYLFSEPNLARAQAMERCLLEEAKIAIVERIRKDSQLVALTGLPDLERLFPSPEPEKRSALLAEIQADERFRDIQSMSGPGGERYFHSDTHLSSNYGRIMVRAKANNPGQAIAELVRDRSRAMPAPTKVSLFNDRVFGIAPAQIEAFLEGLAKPAPEFSDIKKLVHPTTGAVYLYSDRWLLEAAAFRVMDWDEVGAAQNP
ncbi:MAG TPA: hypothetical protein VMK42_15840 [Anaeromyxobacteraceae bacterium]|nr:hypothetical protein [Anaeromyxobacteraceae bacterium]